MNRMFQRLQFLQNLERHLPTNQRNRRTRKRLTEKTNKEKTVISRTQKRVTANLTILIKERETKTRQQHPKRITAKSQRLNTTTVAVITDQRRTTERTNPKNNIQWQ